MKHGNEKVPRFSLCRLGNPWLISRNRGFDNDGCPLQLPAGIDQFAQEWLPFSLPVSQANSEGVVAVAKVIAARVPGVFERLLGVLGDGEVWHRDWRLGFGVVQIIVLGLLDSGSRLVHRIRIFKIRSSERHRHVMGSSRILGCHQPMIGTAHQSVAPSPA
jgi:hypothetical protein